MPDEWLTTKEAAELLNTSARYIRELIAKGKLKARREGTRWLVHSSLSAESADSAGTPAESGRSTEDLVTHLSAQVAEKDRQIDALQRQLEQSSERHDTIVLQLTRQLEQSQRLLEHHQAPWWSRWFKRTKPQP